MAVALRLLITDYKNPDNFRWQLEDANGKFLANHAVTLDTSQPAHQGYADLPQFLQDYALVHTQAELLKQVGEWMGAHVFGPILPAIKKHLTPPVTTVTVRVPENAQDLLSRPLELAYGNGKPLVEQKIRLVYEKAGASEAVTKASSDTLRILAVFSLPDAGSPLNLRQERYLLEQFVHRLQAGGKAVEMRVLQYGANRETLQEALEEGDGWDILHFSGHGHQGVLALEKPDGTADIIGAEELQALLDETKGRVCLLFLSACLSGATSLQAARRALGLEPPTRDDDKDKTETDAATAQATVLPSLGQTLAEQLDSAVIAMRYKVGDRFAADLANSLYDALLTKSQPLPRALHTALADACTPEVAAALPLSHITPILFGARAADLKLTLKTLLPTTVLPLPGMDAFPREPERFVGRLRPMSQGREALAEQGNQRGILYFGMAGAGKTTIATELAYRYREGRFLGFVWYKAPPESSDIGSAFADFMQKLHDQLGLEDTSLLEHTDRPAEFERRTLPRLRELLRDNAYLIVLDNLESLLTANNDWRDPAWGPLLAALLNEQSQSRVILTSRRIPNAFAIMPQLTRCPVHALSFAESILLARELPNLNALFADQEGRALLVWTLRLVQGHPKLLELANGLAADRVRLQAQLVSAESAGEGNAALQAFFDTGESTREEAQFMQAFGLWTRDLAAQLTASARLLFGFLAALEEDDRVSSTLSTTWPDFLNAAPDDLPEAAAARTAPERSLTEGLRELTERGLIEAQLSRSRRTLQLTRPRQPATSCTLPSRRPSARTPPPPCVPLPTRRWQDFIMPTTSTSARTRRQATAQAS